MKAIYKTLIVVSMLEALSLQVSEAMAKNLLPSASSIRHLPLRHVGQINYMAPLDDGAWVLVALVIGYGVQTYKSRKQSRKITDNKES